MSAGRVVILSQRRCGAAAVYRLLAPWVAAQGLGGQPFEWTRALGEVSRAFHEGANQQARVQLEQCLAEGVFFHHRYDLEAWDFNAMLLDALARSGYRVVVMEREIDVDQLLSIVIADRFECRELKDVERLRDRLRSGSDVPDIDGDFIGSLVRGQLASKQWFDQAFKASSVDRMVCRHEEIFLSGVKALEVADGLFEYCGVGSRAAVVDDASLLRFALSGHFFTSGLTAYSPALLRARREIAIVLSNTSSLDDGARSSDSLA